MKSLLLSILLLGLGNTIMAQSGSFPEKCTGVWQGYLMIYADGRIKDSVESRLTVEKLKDSSWIWRTEYAGKEPIVKDYVLRLCETSTGHYIIDEQDGIKLDARLVGNALFSMFEVDGKVLTSTYRWSKEQIVFEITFGVPSDQDTDSEVKNYTVSTVQRAVLKKI